MEINFLLAFGQPLPFQDRNESSSYSGSSSGPFLTLWEEFYYLLLLFHQSVNVEHASQFKESSKFKSSFSSAHETFYFTKQKEHFKMVT